MIVDNPPVCGKIDPIRSDTGDSAIGTALWIGDSTIGLHAGEDSTVNGATALFDNTVELPEGLELELICAVRPGDGRIILWGNGKELAY